MVLVVCNFLMEDVEWMFDGEVKEVLVSLVGKIVEDVQGG